MKKRVYVETSVISWLAANPPSDLSKPANVLKLAKQQQTRIWWGRRSEWDCFITATVLEEIARGNPDAAFRRERKARTLPEFPIPPESDKLADLLLTRKLVPASSKTDADHLALAAVHGADYLLTWNQKHLDNLELRARIDELIKKQGFTPAKVITPERLLGDSR